MERARQVSCPQCGAPAPFRGAAVSLVCEHCGSTVVRAGLDVRLLGRVSALVDDGSPILLGARGRVGDTAFEIVGRLQLRYGRGAWSEWYLLAGEPAPATPATPAREPLLQGAGWLADFQGGYALTRPVPAPPGLPAFHRLSIGTWLEVHGASYMVTEKRAARYQGAEGCLPFLAEPGLTFYSADLAGPDDGFVTLDYGTEMFADRPSVYLGRAVELAELHLDRRRRFAGWRD